MKNYINLKKEGFTMRKIIFSMLLSFVLIGMAGVSLAQTGQDLSAGSQGADDSAGLMTLDFKDADIRNVLRIFSHKMSVNIVASPDVQGSVTVKLINVPWEKALRVILEMHDFAYIKEGNVIKVLSKAKMAQEPLKTEVIALDYAKAQVVIPTIENMLTERGNIKSDDRANLLIISDVPSSFAPIKKVLKRLDAPTPQVMIESKIIETTLDMEKKFGVKWDFLDNYSVSTAAFTKSWSKIFEDTRTDTLGESENYGPVISSSNSRYSPLAGEDSDGNPTTIPAIGLDRENDWRSYKHNDWGMSSGDDALGGGALSKATEVISSVTKRMSTGAVLNASGFSLVMSAIMNDDGTDILSSPSIVTMDNQEAKINVVSDYPVPKYAYNDETASFEIQGFDYIPIGIELFVTPHVSPNGFVTMDLKPTVTRREGLVLFGGEQSRAAIPQISREEIQTQIMVKDGDTIVLGGLVRQFDDYNNQKVPLLHSIPYLGWLFKSKEKTIEKRNLLIFVTPTIIKKENITTITQDRSDMYTKKREMFEEPTELYPDLELQ